MSFATSLNEQVAFEFSAQQQYIAIAVNYDSETLPQLATFFYRQALEERNHAMMITQYLLDAGHPIEVPGYRGTAEQLSRYRRAGPTRARTGEAGQQSDRKPGPAGA